MKISGQLAQDLANYSSYDNLRKIASLVDGQKNAARKILWTVLEKNITQEVKVSRLDSAFQEFTEYLHGSATGVICNMAQDFTGANNLPLLAKSGNFGNRFIQEASAPRYIYTYKHKNTDFLFNKEDSNILEHQYFEGSKIEPKFLVPSLPLLLINGSEGVSSGFAQKILPRRMEFMKQYINHVLSGSKYDKDVIVPYFNGFKGTVEQGITDKQWLIKGVFKRISGTKIEITEVPIGHDLASYIKVLDDLEEKGTIRTYQDKSENDNFNFIVSFDTKFLANHNDEQVLEKLKLISRVTENFTCMDENNKIVQYESADEVIKHFIKVKLDYLSKRKTYQLQKLDDDINILKARYIFVDGVVNNKIIVNKRSKQDIENQLDDALNGFKVDGSFDYLLRMPIYSLTEEKLNELRDKINSSKEEYEKLQSTSIEDMWKNDLNKI